MSSFVSRCRRSSPVVVVRLPLLSFVFPRRRSPSALFVRLVSFTFVFGSLLSSSPRHHRLPTSSFAFRLSISLFRLRGYLRLAFRPPFLSSLHRVAVSRSSLRTRPTSCASSAGITPAPLRATIILEPTPGQVLRFVHHYSRTRPNTRRPPPSYSASYKIRLEA